MREYGGISSSEPLEGERDIPASVLDDEGSRTDTASFQARENNAGAPQFNFPRINNSARETGVLLSVWVA